VANQKQCGIKFSVSYAMTFSTRTMSNDIRELNTVTFLSESCSSYNRYCFLKNRIAAATSECGLESIIYTVKNTKELTQMTLLTTLVSIVRVGLRELKLASVKSEDP